MIIDIHAHNGKFPHTSPMPAGSGPYDHLGETMEEFQADLGRDGVSHCFISSVTALTRDMVEGNVETFRDAELDRRLFGYIYYDPLRVEESLREIERYKSHPKFIGFKSRPECHKMTLDQPAYRPLLETAEAIGKPILVHCMLPADAQAIHDVAPDFDVPIILAHACGAHYEWAVTLVRECENVFVDPVTWLHHPGKIRAILNVIGHQRLVFGSDYGLMSRPRILRRYTEASLTAAEDEAIFRGNARRIFGMKD